MGLVKSFSRTLKPLHPERIPTGAFTVHRRGGIVAQTVSTSYNQELLKEIARVVCNAFQSADANGLPFQELHFHYSGLTISARDLRGGAIIFLSPATANLGLPQLPSTMNPKNPEDFIHYLENYIELWKTFNHYVNLARERKFGREEDSQFLETKSIIAQGFEALRSSEKFTLTKDELAALFDAAPSLRSLADQPDSITQIETMWHRIFINLQSLLGQIKVQSANAPK